ncbi:MAG: transporter [Mesorhizobium sp.]|nr:transporter [Mesorhizobium sp. M8A.F.Ca.ET.021.01.1.1]RUW98178.1 transporter [Mesorhizobium sp. M8A.F.Ca.ET.023.01.1.1]RVD53737.1 transporter [Mesorhizobium sp. M8A.F.Ca.ET.023.02.2.1]RWC69867.1 MAG: transporter [Mesorhizobium sp.]TGP94109.1 transporter [Mesorhizobium sp. M8A.F.Ca.ET.218.01.1.1]TGS48863.1 transporter [Mesorhizobium sp. M8A.F.Ca.ET.182.01.1.1]TGS84437.1 transporter [Mesorhizobium sp. M8A.F.Ca.ET.181.01.1.1]TGT18406.1 transporter [Mesorhizobium sp. M8A.F.Ca.ET.213.01.1.1]T
MAKPFRFLAGVAMVVAMLLPVQALADDADLAKQLSNPIASLISVPFQFNYDSGFGPDDGYRATLNIQPVVPISLNDNWNLISRTILPIITQDDIAGPSGSQSGLGDVTQSLFFSPKAPGPGGVIWGVGPVMLLPTATDDLLGGGKWGAGPTAVALKQAGPWTFGMLANQIWSFAGDSDRSEINATFLQPFLSYTTADAWTFGLNTESTYDWASHQWSVPINLSVAKLVKFGNQPVSLSVGTRYWMTSPESGPEGWGFRGVVTLLFPK